MGSFYAYRSGQSVKKVELTGSRILIFLVLHIILAFLMRGSSLLATLHALLTVILGLVKALTAKEIREVVPYVAYIAGAEVIWRLTDANVFWEIGKYATIAILFVALLKVRKIKNGFLPIAFLLLFLPAAFLTIDARGFTNLARQDISFNLSGPLATGVCLLFFYQVQARVEDLRSWFWALVYPTVSMLTVAVYSMLSAQEIIFTSGGVLNEVTSGGNGANQVSAILGLGALLLVLLTVDQNSGDVRFLALSLGLGLLTQSVLTFSRGGLYNFAAGLLGGIVHFLRKPSRYLRFIILLAFLSVLIIILVVPRLEQFTGGFLSQRFTDLDLTNREELAQAEFRLFKENPVFGVGVGMASYMRGFKIGGASHTEYTRILAEHGVFGILGLLLLALMILRAYRNAPDALTKGLVIAFSAWSLVEMAHAAMRIVAISLMFGWAVVQWKVPDQESSPVTSNALQHHKIVLKNDD